MGKSELRLRYSGFIVFTTQLLGVITGFIFTLLLTRSMSVSEFGIWTNIFDYTPYFMLFGSILPFWATRFTARGKEGAVKTSIISQLFIAIISTLIYFPTIYLISNAIGTSAYLLIYLITGFYILASYLVLIFEGVLQAVKPQGTGYGFIIQEIVKVVVALIIILVFKQVFLGAILALVIAPSIQILYYCWILSPFLKGKINWGYLKQWIKGSPAILFNSLGTQLLSIVLLLLFLIAGSEARAYYQAAASFATIVGYASSLSVAMYPKLLANSCSKEEVGLSFKTVLMMAIPLATIVMVMAISFLTVLNASYGIAWPVLVALTIDTLIILVNTFYSSILLGVEAFDAEGQISFKQLIKSKIFKIFTIPYIQAIIALPLTYLVLSQMPFSSSVEVVVLVIVILMSIHLATNIGLNFLLRPTTMRIPIHWKSITKYVLAALLMGTTLYLLPTTTTLIATVIKTIAGFSLYIVVLLVIDSQARELIRLIWQEIIYTLKRAIHKTDNSGENDSLLTQN